MAFMYRDALQRTILPLIANELLQRLHDKAESSPKSLTPDMVAGASCHGPSPVPSMPSVHANSSSRHNQDGIWRLGLRCSTPGLETLATGVERSGRSASLSSVIRSRSDLFLATAAMLEGSMHGRSHLRRCLSKDLMQAGEQVKAARCDALRLPPRLCPAALLRLASSRTRMNLTGIVVLAWLQSFSVCRLALHTAGGGAVRARTRTSGRDRSRHDREAAETRAAFEWTPPPEPRTWGRILGHIDSELPQVHVRTYVRAASAAFAGDL
jgi:hypothetical protein